MVSRGTRNYKEKKPIAFFGQFMLPIAIILAIALLYFSIKLFFLTPNRAKTSDVTSSPTVSAEVSAVPVDVAKDNTQPGTGQPKIIAGPVTQQPGQMTSGPTGQPTAQSPVPSASKPTGTPKTQQPGQTAAKPAETPKDQPTASGPPASPAVRRYDIQIGAFTSRENALQLTQKVRGQGYDVYINEAVQDGLPYFRVRVKGTAESREIQALSAKLQGQGYPVYVVPIN